MTLQIDRRSFIQTAAAAAATCAIARPASGEDNSQTAGAAARPVVIASGNGLQAVGKAAEMIGGGADALDAVIAGVNIVEADPNDHSVGLGGLPNERGVVELDASVMHGPTHNCGSVAALRNIVHPSRVAKLVMERTDHCMIVGQGALDFAKAHGFVEQELLTDEARRTWLDWKERMSDRDDWVSPPAKNGAGDKTGAAAPIAEAFTYGTINCCAVDSAGNLSGVTTTSGLSYKIPGRVGDSPIIGAGLYVDNNVGAAGATGRGEAVIRNCGSYAVVSQMAAGKSPVDACIAALERICDHTRDSRLLDDAGRPNFQVNFYAVAKDGRFGSASIWSGLPRKQYAVYANGRSRLEDTAYLFKTGA